MFPGHTIRKSAKIRTPLITANRKYKPCESVAFLFGEIRDQRSEIRAQISDMRYEI
jgi:hypothetical protein